MTIQAPNSANDAFARLSSFANFERRRPGQPHRFGLESMHELCESLGRPQDRLGRVVQIAGSKGKGTAAVFLSSMLEELDVPVATYLSPHLVDVRERVLWRGQMVSGEELATFIHRACDAAHKPDTRYPNTWFEVLTAAAFLVFARKRPEVCVLEVGLGGRLDSTTIVPKHACGITNIELEHTEVLGDTIEKIAREKAGILRPGLACVTMATGVALDVIRAAAVECGASLRELGRDYRLVAATRTGSGFDLRAEIAGREVHVELPVTSSVQVESFVFALALLAELLPERWPEVLRRPVSQWLASLPGRFEIVQRDPPIVLDGAHTNASMQILARDLESAFPSRRYALVLGIGRGKHWRSGLGSLASLVDRAWVAPLRERESERVSVIARWLRDRGVVCEEVASIGEGTECAMEARQHGTGVLVTGSLYAVGEARKVLD